jgi:hypothetical protein
MPTRYYITLPDPARGGDADLAFKSQGAEGLAAEFQDALRSDRLFQRWRLTQEDPDEVDAAFGANDPNATVQGKQQDLHIDLVVITSLSSSILRQRLGLLAGNGWQLRDVSAA